MIRTTLIIAFLSTAAAVVAQPRQSDIQPNAFRLTWETSQVSAAVVFYGTQPDQMNQFIPIADQTKAHTVQLNGLQPATIYWVRVATIEGQDTTYAPAMPYATQSLSSGQIKVFFNQGIDPSAANGLQPDGTTYADVLAETLARIGAAQQSIDVAMYNCSRSDLVTALTFAQGRGVQVRFIAASATDNNALKPAPLFPVLYGNHTALMHNKFMVIDADLPDQAWVMSGSMNWTVSNMIQDYNNTLFIQDQSLARAYEMEFEEMWGGNGPLPDISQSRFGNSKTDNTPHQFLIGGREVACYFSPTDQVTQHIVDAIDGADHQASFAIFTFTKNEIGNALIGAHNSGAWVRGIIENIDDPGAEYSWLLSKGVPVKAHPASSLLHHKYAVLDAGYPLSDPTVVTGSHNWSQSAESVNDENTLIIRDNNIATLFQAEFERRWWETGSATVSIDDRPIEVFPNPVRDVLFLRQPDGDFWAGRFEIRDLNGRLCHSGEVSGPETRITLPILAPGIYFVRISTDRGNTNFPIQTLQH